jgi:DNA-damage-inducible protein J
MLSARVDDLTKKEFDEFCRQVGSTPSTIMKMFATKVAREKRLPFAVEVDPFYSEANQKELKRRVADLDAGRNCHTHELIET